MRDLVECPELGPMPRELCLERKAKGVPLCLECKIPEGEEMSEEKKRVYKCKYPGCNRTVWRRGYCAHHLKEVLPDIYQQYREGRGRNQKGTSGGLQSKDVANLETPSSVDDYGLPQEAYSPEGFHEGVTVQIAFPQPEYDRLRQAAEAEMRPIEYQIRWLIKKGLEAQG